MKARLYMAVITIAALITAPLSFAADEKTGIFETVHASSVSFDETVVALEAARHLPRAAERARDLAQHPCAGLPELTDALWQRRATDSLYPDAVGVLVRETVPELLGDQLGRRERVADDDPQLRKTRPDNTSQS